MLFASMPVSQIFPNPQLKTYEVYGARIVDFLCEQGLGIMAAAEETVKLSKLKVEQIFSDERSDHIDVFVRVNKEFLKTPIAQYFIDWIFECRDEALHSIGIAPSFAYTKLSGKKN